MRKFLFLILLLTACAAFAQDDQDNAGPAIPPQKSGPVKPGENAAKARAILNQMIEKLGGDAYMNIQTMEQEGRSYSYSHGQPEGYGIEFWMFTKFPDKQRVEMTKKRDVVYINNGDKGYEVTYKGTAPEETKALKNYLRNHDHSIEVVLHKWLSDPSTALFYDGPAVAEQKACDSVTLMTANNDSVTLYIDSFTHLPIKKTFEWRDPLDNLKNVEGEVYDNYKPEQGIMTPHVILHSHNGDTTSQRFITSVKYNTPLADSMFEATVTYDPYKRSSQQ